MDSSGDLWERGRVNEELKFWDPRYSNRLLLADCPPRGVGAYGGILTVPASSTGSASCGTSLMAITEERVKCRGCAYPRLALATAESEDIPQREVRGGGPERGTVSRVLEPRSLVGTVLEHIPALGCYCRSLLGALLRPSLLAAACFPPCCCHGNTSLRCC